MEHDASMDNQPDTGISGMGKSISDIGTSMGVGMDMGMSMGMSAQEMRAWTYGLYPCLASRGGNERDRRDSSPDMDRSIVLCRDKGRAQEGAGRPPSLS